MRRIIKLEDSIKVVLSERITPEATLKTVGIARCNPGDVFNEEVGTEIAHCRACIRLNKKKKIVLQGVIKALASKLEAISRILSKEEAKLERLNDSTAQLAERLEKALVSTGHKQA